MNIPPAILIITSLTITALFASCNSKSAAPPTNQPTRPNILIILADDLGYSDIAPYGSEIATPALAGLAAGARRYRTFYNAARCCPTRAALLTGRYPHAAGMGGMVSPAGAAPGPGPYQGYLRPDVPTIAERLGAAGYQTWLSGKWHVGESTEHWPHRRGFNRSFGLISGASSYYTIRTDQPRLRQMVTDSLPFTPPDTGFYATTAYSDFAVERVLDAGRDTTPFFGYLAYTAPHWPLHAPEATVQKYLARYRTGWDALRRERHERQIKLGLQGESVGLPPTDPEVPDWETVPDKATWVRKMAVYAAMVEEMDRGIGRVIAALDSTGQRENTLIFFLSDNGGCDETIAQRGLNRPGATVGQPGSYLAYGRPWSQLSNVPFRRYKAWVNEGGVATPLLLSWPKGNVETGWTDATGHVTDLLPTCLVAAGLPIPQGLPGNNLLAAVPTDRDLFWEHQGQKAIRRGNWKLLSNAPDDAWRLYNLATDPTENQDLASMEPARVDSLETAYLAWWAEMEWQN